MARLNKRFIREIGTQTKGKELLVLNGVVVALTMGTPRGD